MRIDTGKVLGILEMIKTLGHAIYEAVAKIKSQKEKDTKVD